jgi:cytochrome c
MGRCLVRIGLVLGLALASAAPAMAQETRAPGDPGLGTPLTQSDIDQLSITIFPDGLGLPEGRGPVITGKALYAERCSRCHGAKGKEGPASRLVGSDGFFSIWDPMRILRIKNVSPMLVDSTGASWPYATSVFDYTRRAMPHDAPKSLTNDEVYALTAYILFLNDLVKRNFVANRKSLVNVVMPGLARSTSAWEDEE